MTSRSEATHLTRVSRLAPDDDIKKVNSIYRLVRKLCSTVMLVFKTDVLMMMDSCVSERDMRFVS